jgi:hypothetical protein
MRCTLEQCNAQLYLLLVDEMGWQEVQSMFRTFLKIMLYGIGLNDLHEN